MSARVFKEERGACRRKRSSKANCSTVIQLLPLAAHERGNEAVSLFKISGMNYLKLGKFNEMELICHKITIS